MADIYEQHAKAFKAVSAYVIMRGGDKVATIAFKSPADGAGRLYVYIHWVGVPMVRGHADGYGYDKRTAACANAARNMCKSGEDGAAIDTSPDRKAFHNALAADRGPSWDSALREAGFDVLQAV